MTYPDLIAALKGLENAATKFGMEVLTHDATVTREDGASATLQHAPVFEDLLKALKIARDLLAAAQQQPDDDLLTAARQTLALWDKHGLGDDEEESEPIYTALKRAVESRAEQ